MTYLQLAEGLANELKDVIYKYSESIPLATAVGVLEIVKVELIREHTEEDE